jgi:hypothetical protein
MDCRPTTRGLVELASLTYGAGEWLTLPRGRIFRLQILGPELLLTTDRPLRGERDGLLLRTLIEALIVMPSSGESACGSGDCCNDRE